MIILSEAREKRIKKIISNFENNLCIYDCGCSVEKIIDPCNHKSYKCSKCGNEYTAKAVLEAITIIRSNNI